MKQLEMDLDRPEVAEAKAKVREMAEKHRAERAAERAKPEPSSRPIPSATDPESVLGSRKSSTGGGGMGTGKMSRDITKNYKSGGKVKSASARADGCAIRGKTKA